MQLRELLFNFLAHLSRKRLPSDEDGGGGKGGGGGGGGGGRRGAEEGFELIELNFSRDSDTVYVGPHCFEIRRFSVK